MSIKQIEIGDKFTKPDDKVKIAYTVTDIYTVTNSQGEFVKHEYIASNDFMGQTIKHRVPEVTIQRNLITNQ